MAERKLPLRHAALITLALVVLSWLPILWAVGVI